MTKLLPDWQSFSLKEQIGQMIVVRASGYLFDAQIRYPEWEVPNQQLKQWLTELNLGGVILLGGSSAELSMRSQQLQSWANTPLLIAADIEEGVGQRFSGASWLPPPMALSAIAAQNLPLAQEYALKMGEITAKEALTVGINWLLAPVVDVNNNPANPVINIRAFGDNPVIVSNLATAFIEGAKQYPVLTTAKHFPGHGDTVTDSHLELPTLLHSDERLTQIELPPFKKAIELGVDSVMTAHLAIPAWDAKYPVTLSESILTGKLRQELGFEGIIVTDALIMGGMTKYASPAEIAVKAVEAGVDVLLMPDNPVTAIESIYDAVQSGRISEDRIHQSLTRIWQAKEKVVFYPPNSLFELFSTEATKLTQSILHNSLRMGGDIPLKPLPEKSLRNLIVIDDLLNCNFLDIHTSAVAIPKKLGYQLQIVDRHTIENVQPDARDTLLQIFIRGNPFRGSAGFTPQAQKIYEQLIESNKIQALIIYGSPYVLDWFFSKISPELPWLFTYGQMPIAQAIALEKLFNLSLNFSSTQSSQDFGF